MGTLHKKFSCIPLMSYFYPRQHSEKENIEGKHEAFVLHSIELMRANTTLNMVRWRQRESVQRCCKFQEISTSGENICPDHRIQALLR